MCFHWYQSVVLDVAVRLRHLCEETNIAQNPTTIFQDNQGTIKCSTGGRPWHFSRRKHIDILHNFIVGMMADGSLTLEKLGGNEMLADFLIKPQHPA